MFREYDTKLSTTFGHLEKNQLVVSIGDPCRYLYVRLYHLSPLFVEYHTPPRQWSIIHASHDVQRSPGENMKHASVRYFMHVYCLRKSQVVKMVGKLRP